MKQTQAIAKVILWLADSSFVEVSFNETLRFNRFRIGGIHKLGQGVLRQISINEQPVLVSPIDACLFSRALEVKLLDEFWAEHGLTDSSFAERDAYCDEHELCPPDPCFIPLDALVSGSKLRVDAQLPQGCSLTFSGYTLVESSHAL